MPASRNALCAERNRRCRDSSRTRSMSHSPSMRATTARCGRSSELDSCSSSAQSACARTSDGALRALRVELAKNRVECRAKYFPLRLVAVAPAIADIAPPLLQCAAGGRGVAVRFVGGEGLCLCDQRGLRALDLAEMSGEARID